MIARRARLRIASCAAMLVAACLPATAQESPVQVVVGITPAGGYSEIDGWEYRQGFSLGLDYFFTERWAAEIRSAIDGYARTGSGDDLEAYSLELAAHYYLARGRKWELFSAAGLRYAESDFGPPASAGESATGLLIGLGTEYSVSRRFSFRLDATAVTLDLGGNDERFERLRLGLGLGYRF